MLKLIFQEWELWTNPLLQTEYTILIEISQPMGGSAESQLAMVRSLRAKQFKGNSSEEVSVLYRALSEISDVIGEIIMLKSSTQIAVDDSSPELGSLYAIFVEGCGEILSIKIDGIQDWTLLGFQQRARPSSDFRAVGSLALNHIHGFAKSRPEMFSKIVLESSAAPSTVWYPFALSCIHVTNFLINSLLNRQLQHAIFKSRCVRGTSVSELLLDIFSGHVIGFHSYWLENVELGRVKTTLDFEDVFDEYKWTVLETLYKF